MVEERKMAAGILQEEIGNCFLRGVDIYFLLSFLFFCFNLSKIFEVINSVVVSMVMVTRIITRLNE